MIDLSLTAKKMLEELNVPQNISPLYLNITSDTRLITEPVVSLLLKFHHRDDIFRELKKALKKRYSKQISFGQLERDLMNPLKRALGNSFKHGNLKNIDKHLILEALVTERGVFIKLTDEGDGFNVKQVYDKFQAGFDYAKNKGMGFLTYASSQSHISFSKGGKSFILLFLIGNNRYLNLKAKNSEEEANLTN